MKANRYLIVAIFIVVAYNTKIMMPISNIDMGLFILMTLNLLLFIYHVIKE